MPQPAMTSPAKASPILPAWTAPRSLVELTERNGHADVVYVHVPFASALESAEGPEAHRQLVRVVGDALWACLSGLGCSFGLQQWPPDDFVGWVADTAVVPAPRIESAMELRVGLAVTKAVRESNLPDTVKERASEVTVSREPLPLDARSNPDTGFARAVSVAQRSACDPVARDLLTASHLIDRALAARAFRFFYQPIVDCSAAKVLAYEALCRGTLDEFRFPDLIFSVAERTKRIWELGRVLRELVAQELSAKDPQHHQGMVFINVHPLDIDDPTFLEQALHGSLAKHAHSVVVELTERAAISDYRRVKAFFATLREHGYRLAIDDLGSGYAGLTALAELEPDFIKFDMGLVRDLHLHPVKQRLIRRMHEFAQEIGAQTISEGVENEDERDALLQAGCSIMQGYFFARPAPGFPTVPSERFVPTPTPRATSSG